MNIVVLIFAVLLCIANAVLWTLYTEMPLVGIAWIGAAFASMWLRKWSIY